MAAIDASVIKTINDNSVDERIERFLTLATPIKKLIKVSESDESGPEKICCEWLDVRDHLKNSSASSYGSAQNKKKYLEAFESYFVKALTSGHFAAVLLMPNREMLLKAKEKMTSLELRQGIDYLSKNGVDEAWLIQWLENGVEVLQVRSLIVGLYNLV